MGEPTLVDGITTLNKCPSAIQPPSPASLQVDLGSVYVIENITLYGTNGNYMYDMLQQKMRLETLAIYIQIGHYVFYNAGQSSLQVASLDVAQLQCHITISY